MSSLAKLSIVIPTYNRLRYILRNLHYWSGSVVTIHVIDGSEQPIPPEEIAKLSSNINYCHLPTSIWSRLGKAVELVQTEYVALLGDDEFFLPKALEACIQELETDETLVSCMGRCLAFQLSSKKLMGWPAYTEMTNYAVLHDNPIARMIYHMNPYTCSTIYSVVRAPIWRQAMDILSKKQFLVYSLEELQFELSVCYQGKSKVIQRLMWLRSGENDGVRDQREIVRFDQWWADKEKSNEREEFLTLMANGLAGGETTRLESVREGVKAACNEFCKFSVRNGYLRGFRAAIAKIGNRLPPAIKAAGKAPVIKLLAALPDGDIYARLHNKSFLQAAKDMEATGVHVDFDQLSQIAARIEEFHDLPSHKSMARVSQCGVDA